jgi:hypothetical protein
MSPEICVDGIFYIEVGQDFDAQGYATEPVILVTYPTLPEDYEDLGGEPDWVTIVYEGELWGWQAA